MAVEPVVAVGAFDHAVVPVMDLWRAERFYTEVLDGAIFQKVGMTFRPPDAHEAFVGAREHRLALRPRQPGFGDEPEQLALQPAVAAARDLPALEHVEQRGDPVAAPWSAARRRGGAAGPRW